MSDHRCPSDTELLLAAMNEAIELLFTVSDAPGTRITRETSDGEAIAAVFVLRDPDHVAAFTKLYHELLDAESEQAPVFLPTCRVDDTVEN
jgi:hypothetical protein